MLFFFLYAAVGFGIVGLGWDPKPIIAAFFSSIIIGAVWLANDPTLCMLEGLSR